VTADDGSLLRRGLEMLYFMAPAYVANMSPPLVKYWKGWNPPLSLRGLGDAASSISSLR
jgi:hypothetical protein